MLHNELARLGAKAAAGGNGLGDSINQGWIDGTMKWLGIILLGALGLGIMASALTGNARWGKIGTKVAIALIGVALVAAAAVWWGIGSSVGTNIGG